jgi:hypothetical protein
LIAAALLVRRRYLFVVPRPIPAAPSIYSIVMYRPLPAAPLVVRCMLGAKTDSCGLSLAVLPTLI